MSAQAASSHRLGSHRARWRLWRSKLSQCPKLFLSLLATALLAASLGAGCEGDLSLPTTAFPLTRPEAAEKPARIDLATDLPNGHALVEALLEAVNGERARKDLRPLKLDPTLNQIADFYARRMIESGYFGHTDPFDGSTVDARAAHFGYAYRKVGENLGAGHASVAEVLAHWMRSPGHRANILDPAYTHIGIAVKQGGEYGIYWVQEFGCPLVSADAPEQRPASRTAGADSEDTSSSSGTEEVAPSDAASPAADESSPSPSSRPDHSEERG